MHNNKYCNIVKQKQITNKKGKQKEKEKEMKKENKKKSKRKEKETINKKTNDLQEGVNLIDHVLDPDTIHLDKLKNGLFLGGKKIQAVVSCFVGDTRESFPAKGRLQPGALNSCSICKAKLGDLNYSNPNFQHEKRDKNETKMIQKKMIESYNDKNFNLYTLRGIKEKETETGVKFQQDNIWIHELELDPTSTSHFPICWFHLLLEGLIKNIFKIMCSSMRVTFLNLANQRYKNQITKRFQKNQ
ncbi:hypothetical protein M0813_11737 [Anaeramoeba flamelloides]|uniref:Uncharacterized protein n=1 Tax=Anaeramoeba flamelloides TaxID=1746091 RepID=A0ABQ8ZDU0_9EUKA|nr:hypothetical protein M0813_11737 [Anaeramoeba flamelloides]